MKSIRLQMSIATHLWRTVIRNGRQRQRMPWVAHSTLVRLRTLCSLETGHQEFIAAPIITVMVVSQTEKWRPRPLTQDAVRTIQVPLACLSSILTPQRRLDPALHLWGYRVRKRSLDTRRSPGIYSTQWRIKWHRSLVTTRTSSWRNIKISWRRCEPEKRVIGMWTRIRRTASLRSFTLSKT